MEQYNELHKNIIKFTLSLYNNPLLPRNIVQIVIDYFKDFIENIFVPNLENQIKHLLKKYCSNNIIEDVTTICQSNKTPFQFVSTEHLRFKIYESIGIFIKPEEFVIGQSLVEKNVNEQIISLNENIFGVNISLAHSLKLFLEIPDIFNQILDYTNQLNTEQTLISNFIQADLWKNKSATHDNKFVLPLNIFFDDLETGNALGSHAGQNKLGLTYASIPCLPPYLVSKLNSIFLCTVFYSNDRKIFGNYWIFKKLIDELNNLQNNGIIIIHNKTKKQIYFDYTLNLGDNLGLNSILGFVESFSAHHPCRICCMDKINLKISTSENVSLLRTVENYNSDVEKNDVSSTGIKEECVFHKISGYHVCNNQSVDIMHDVFEGSGNYAITAILHHFLFVEKIINYPLLISRIETFEYGFLEINNKPPSPTLEQIRDKKVLKMSASEMTCFIRYLGLMIGDLVPENNETWNFYLKLRQIVDIITAPRIVKSHAVILNDLVKQYNSLYIKYLGHLTPKSHNLLHYGRIMLQNGPLVHLSSMRFESKNRQIKMIANAQCCNKNLLMTVALKHQLKMAYMTVSSELSNDSKLGLIDFENENTLGLFPSESQVRSLKHVINNGIKYQEKTIIVLDINNESYPIFGRIHKIYQVNNENIYFHMYSIETQYFDDHCHAFVVKMNGKLDKLKKIEEILQISPCLPIKRNNKFYIATRHLI